MMKVSRQIVTAMTAFMALTAALAAGCRSQAPAAFALTAQAYEIHVDANALDGAGAAPATADQDVVVATYNVYGMAQPEALRTDLASLASVDVWALQEVPVPRLRDREDAQDADLDARYQQAFRKSLRKVLPPGTWHVRAVAVNPFSPGGRSCDGQVIASRLPIRESAVWPLGGAGKRRVALVVVIDSGVKSPAGAADTVAIVNTDHEPSFFSPAAGNDAQVARLLEHLAKRDHPTIVAGDFNPTGQLWRLRSHPQDVARLRSAMTRAGFINASHDDADTFRGFPSRLRLDHLFLRDLRWLGGGVASAARGSDHLPLWCRVQPIRRAE